MGGNTALQLAIRHPEQVRKLIVAAANFHPDGYYPEVLAGIEEITPEVFAGSPMETLYREVAPNPDGFPGLVEKLKQLDVEFQGWPAEDIAAIAAPTFIIIGDADVVRPEHAVEMFRLVGGGVPGDLTGLPPDQLAILPGTTHITLVENPERLVAMIEAFLNLPMPEAP
jgi:pimeloyl-ACP methyl ester carboxylesterase